MSQVSFGNKEVILHYFFLVSKCIFCFYAWLLLMYCIKNGTYALCWKNRTNHILCNIAWGYIENLRDNRIIYNLFLTIDLFRFWTYHFIIILAALPLEAFTSYFSFFLNKKKIVLVFFSTGDFSRENDNTLPQNSYKPS